MLTIKIGEKEEFQYNASEHSIYAADGEEDWCYTWKLEFASKEQIGQFKEMLELMEERLEEIEKENKEPGT